MIRKKKRIGFFSLDIANTFNELLLRGVTDGALEEGLELLVVHGGQLRSPHYFEAARNGLYALVNPDTLDGLLLADIFSFLEAEEKERFLAPFAHVPKVTVGHKLQGVPRVLVDNTPGFRDLVIHLMDQGSRSFAVITGPRLNGDTQERMEALVATLGTRGLRLSPELIVEGTFGYQSGIDAVMELLDYRSRHFDCLICFNDNMAMAALQELKRRGIKVPDDLRVSGFDNTEESQNLNPPITTVNFPMYELGKTGVKILAQLLETGTGEEETTLKSRFIPRRSSGFWEGEDHWEARLPGDLETVDRLVPGHESPNDLNHRRPFLAEYLLELYMQEARGVLNEKHLSQVREDLTRFIELVLQTLRTQDNGTFMSSLHAHLDNIMNREWDLRPWVYLFDVMGRTFYQKGPMSSRSLIQLMFSEAVLQTRNTKRLVTINEKIQDRYRTERLLELGEALSTSFDARAILQLLESTLPVLGVRTCFLVLFKPGTQGRRATLALSLGAVETSYVRMPQEFDAKDLLPESLAARFPNLFIDSLHIKEELLGYILFNPIDRPGLVFKTLRHQISSALLAASLMGQINQHASQLEEKIKERTRELEISNERLQKEIKEREIMEKELLRQKNLESLGLLAGGIAHDFNNLLTGIMGNVSLMQMDELHGEEAVNCLSDILKAVERAKGLTQQLLTFSRGGSPIKSRTSLRELVEETSRFALRGTTISPRFQFPSEPWEVDVDAGQISQVLNNLILNAKQAMPQGGILEFICSHQVLTVSRPGLSPGSYVCLAVKDQGSGMGPEVLEKLFEPYFTTKVHGNGLGLATSMNIVKRHGGHIEVDSEAGQGTTFTIYLPQSRQTIARPSPLPSQTPALQKGLRFLLLDDEVPIQKLMEKILRHLGHELTITSEGSQTVSAYRRAWEAGTPFNALILDLTIPGGLGGQEVLDRIKSFDPQARALASSGYSESAVMSEFSEYGFRGILKKPYTIQEVEKALKGLFT